MTLPSLACSLSLRERAGVREAASTGPDHARADRLCIRTTPYVRPPSPQPSPEGRGSQAGPTRHMRALGTAGGGAPYRFAPCFTIFCARLQRCTSLAPS